MHILNRYKDISTFKKHFDIVTNNFHYPLATFLCALISPTGITPNMVTLAAFISELTAIVLILIDFPEYKLLIVIFLQFGWVLDLMDGMLARYKKLGFYDPENKSLKGYYWDSVSDHILRIIVLTVLGYYLAQYKQNGLIYAIAGISIHAITQIEHVIRDFILKNVKTKISKARPDNFINEIVLLFNNIYIFYFIFILWNRIDLLFIVLPIVQVSLLIKRFFQFSFSDN